MAAFIRQGEAAVTMPYDPFGQQQGGWGPPSVYGEPGSAGTDGKAIAALVTAVLSFSCLFFLSVVALVLARQSSENIAASGGRLRGTALVAVARFLAWVNIGLVACVALLAALSYALPAGGG